MQNAYSSIPSPSFSYSSSSSPSASYGFNPNLMVGYTQYPITSHALLLDGKKSRTNGYRSTMFVVSESPQMCILMLTLKFFHFSKVFSLESTFLQFLVRVILVYVLGTKPTNPSYICTFKGQFLSSYWQKRFHPFPSFGNFPDLFYLISSLPNPEI